MRRAYAFSVADNRLILDEEGSRDKHEAIDLRLLPPLCVMKEGPLFGALMSGGVQNFQLGALMSAGMQNFQLFVVP